MRKTFKKAKKAFLFSVLTACFVLIGLGFVTGAEHPIRTMCVDLACFAWIMVFAYANDFFCTMER